MRSTRSRTSSGPRRFMGGAAISANRTAPSWRTLSAAMTLSFPGDVEAVDRVVDRLLVDRLLVDRHLGLRRRHHPARVGLRVSRTRLTTRTQTRPMMGETNRE